MTVDNGYSIKSDENLSCVLHKANDLRLENCPLPDKPKKNEVLLQTSKVGICGSDVSYWVKGAIGSYVSKQPMILGHETSAVVVEVGEGVKGLKPGDRVAVEPGISCRYCVACKEGNYNLCPDIFFSATPPDNGTLTRYFKHAADFCYKLPDHVSDEEGALMEPLSVALYACSRAAVSGGQTILICGAGPIGMMCVLAAKAFGVNNICITDMNTERLQTAKSLGASRVYEVVKGKSEDENVDNIIDSLGCRPDIVFECTGVESSTRLAILTCKSAGTVMLVGMGPMEMKIPTMIVTLREVDIKGCFRYKNCYPKALNLIASGQIDVKQLITHRYKLEEALDAFDTARSGKGVKVIIDCLLKN